MNGVTMQRESNDFPQIIEQSFGGQRFVAGFAPSLPDIEYYDLTPIMGLKIVAKNKHCHGDATIRGRIRPNQQDLQFQVILTLQFSLPCFGNSLT